MSIFRSVIMKHKNIRIPRERAVEIMDLLGRIKDGIEFIDLNKNVVEGHKNFYGMIKRCDENEKRIVHIEKLCERYKFIFSKYTSYDKFESDLDFELAQAKNKKINLFDLFENEVVDDEKKVLDLINSYDQIADNLDYIKEKKAVYDKISQLIVSGNNEFFELRQISSGDDETGNSSGIQTIAGVIKAEDEIKMKKMIMRISRGRATPTYFDLEIKLSASGEKVQKKIFTIFFPSGNDNVLFHKLIKACDIYNASRFSLPKSSDIKSEIIQLQRDISEKSGYLKQAKTMIEDFLKERVGNVDEQQAARYELLKQYFKKEKLIYQNLNKCVLLDNFIDGAVWIPEELIPKVIEEINSISNEHSLTAIISDLPETSISPPTFIATNDFTWAFQEVTDSYGIPKYREINPSLFTIVTFPFLFGVMFGDIGHGGLLFAFGLYLTLWEDEIKKSNSALKPALKARYLLLLMGFFALFCGFMYNDFLSLPLNIFGSCYENDIVNKVAVQTKGCTYPFGLDPKWYVSSNELNFFNSLKMKTSVILGVTHMMFGIILKGVNCLYFKNYIEFVFDFIPQIIFMGVLFFYLVIMIFIKWSINWENNTQNAPSLINLLMNIFLNFGSVDGKPLFQGQESLNFYIFIIAIICVPLLLFPKPIIIYLSQKSKKLEAVDHYQEMVEQKVHEKEEHHNEEFSELFIHQVIETIEFVLGAISNTASYLRLWALSLAHAQLAKVFFEKFLLSAIHEGSILMIVFGYFFFANATFGVLMCMDLMECCLHTLRLHWVEFQNKFYKGDGYKFSPFSFRNVIEIVN